MGIHNLLLSVGALQLPPWHSSLGPFVFLYVGPDAILPLASAVAAIVGVLLIFWRYIARLTRLIFRFVAEKTSQLFAKRS